LNNKAIAHRPAKVICLGEILFDYLADDLGKSVSEVTSWTPYPGGAPANVACALAKLGTSSAFIGCVGRDDPGKELVSLLESIAVDVSGIQYTDLATTRGVYVTRSSSGDRTFAGFRERPADKFADAYLQAELLPTELFLEAEYLTIGTLELAYPQSRAAVFRALELAMEYHLKVVLDVNWRPNFWLDESEARPLIERLWSYVDFVKLAEEEAQWLFDTADAGSIFYRLGSVEGVLVSNGAAEVSYCLAENEGKVAPFAVEVKDTTGAGDAFLGGLIHQLCQIKISELAEAQIAENIVKYACAVGGLTTTESGAIAAQPNPKLVTALMQKSSVRLDLK